MLCHHALRLMSVSVMIPASAPDSSTIKDASLRLFVNICATLSTVSPTDDMNGFSGRNFESGLSSESSVKGLSCGSLNSDGPLVLSTPTEKMFTELTSERSSVSD